MFRKRAQFIPKPAMSESFTGKPGGPNVFDPPSHGLLNETGKGPMKPSEADMRTLEERMIDARLQDLIADAAGVNPSSLVADKLRGQAQELGRRIEARTKEADDAAAIRAFENDFYMWLKGIWTVSVVDDNGNVTDEVKHATPAGYGASDVTATHPGIVKWLTTRNNTQYEFKQMLTKLWFKPDPTAWELYLIFKYIVRAGITDLQDVQFIDDWKIWFEEGGTETGPPQLLQDTFVQAHQPDDAPLTTQDLEDRDDARSVAASDASTLVSQVSGGDVIMDTDDDEFVQTTDDDPDEGGDDPPAQGGAVLLSDVTLMDDMLGDIDEQFASGDIDLSTRNQLVTTAASISSVSSMVTSTADPVIQEQQRQLGRSQAFIRALQEELDQARAQQTESGVGIASGNQRIEELEAQLREQAAAYQTRIASLTTESERQLAQYETQTNELREVRGMLQTHEASVRDITQRLTDTDAASAASASALRDTLAQQTRLAEQLQVRVEQTEAEARRQQQTYERANAQLQETIREERAMFEEVDRGTRDLMEQQAEQLQADATAALRTQIAENDQLRAELERSQQCVRVLQEQVSGLNSDLREVRHQYGLLINAMQEGTPGMRGARFDHQGFIEAVQAAMPTRNEGDAGWVVLRFMEQHRRDADVGLATAIEGAFDDPSSFDPSTRLGLLTQGMLRLGQEQRERQRNAMQTAQRSGIDQDILSITSGTLAIEDVTQEHAQLAILDRQRDALALPAPQQSFDDFLDNLPQDVITSDEMRAFGDGVRDAMTDDPGLTNAAVASMSAFGESAQQAKNRDGTYPVDDIVELVVDAFEQHGGDDTDAADIWSFFFGNTADTVRFERMINDEIDVGTALRQELEEFNGRMRNTTTSYRQIIRGGGGVKSRALTTTTRPVAADPTPVAAQSSGAIDVDPVGDDPGGASVDMTLVDDVVAQIDAIKNTNRGVTPKARSIIDQVKRFPNYDEIARGNKKKIETAAKNVATAKRKDRDAAMQKLFELFL